MNNISLIGRITRDPEIRYTKGEEARAVCSFSLAVPRDYIRDGQPNADFINCVAFGGPAKIIEKYMPKGTRIGVTGRFVGDRYKGKDGKVIYTIKVIADHVYFADGRKGQRYDEPAPALDEEAAEMPPDSWQPYESEGDLPF